MSSKYLFIIICSLVLQSTHVLAGIACTSDDRTEIFIEYSESKKSLCMNVWLEYDATQKYVLTCDLSQNQGKYLAKGKTSFRNPRNFKVQLNSFTGRTEVHVENYMNGRLVWMSSTRILKCQEQNVY